MNDVILIVILCIFAVVNVVLIFTSARFYHEWKTEELINQRASAVLEEHIRNKEEIYNEEKRKASY